MTSQGAIRDRWGLAVDLSRRYGFIVLFGLALIFALVPIYATGWLPMQDLGGHVELMDVVARYGDVDTAYAANYLLPDAPPGPNSLSLFFAWLLGPLLGVYGVAKLLVAAYVVGVPLAALAICRSFGRSKWLAFATVPLVYNSIFAIGYLNYLAAMPLLLLVIPTTKRLAVEGNWRSGALAALNLTLLFFAHIIPYLIGIGLALFIVVLYSPRKRDLTRAWVVLPSLPFAAAWVIRMFIVGRANTAGQTFAATGDALNFDSWDGRLESLRLWGMRIFRDGTDEMLLVGLIAVWLVAMMLAQRPGVPTVDPPPTPGGGWRARLRPFGLEIISLGFLAAYFLLPSEVSEVAITDRLVVPMLWLFMLWPRLRFRTWSLLLAAPLVAAALYFPWIVRLEFARWEHRHVGRLYQAIAALPDGSRLAFVRRTPYNSVIWMHPHWHLPRGMHAIANGGTTDESFATAPYTPVQFKPGKAPVTAPTNLEDTASLYDFDYYLIYDLREPKRALAHGSLKKRWSWGGWYLFDVVDKDDAEAVMTVGGGGGQADRWSCPSNQAFTGLDVQLQRWVQTVRPRCGRLEPGGKVRGGSSGPRFGAVSGEAEGRKLECPEGEVVVGLFGQQSVFTTEIGLKCLTPREARDEDGWPRLPTLVSAVAPERGEFFALDCPPGTMATQWRGRSGVLIDQVGIACEAVEPRVKKKRSKRKTGARREDDEAADARRAAARRAARKAKASEDEPGPRRTKDGAAGKGSGERSKVMKAQKLARPPAGLPVKGAKRQGRDRNGASKAPVDRSPRPER